LGERDRADRFRVAPDRAAANVFPRPFGFDDTSLSQFASLNHGSGLINFVANPYAAMPSLHAADALIVGIVLCVIIARNVFAEGRPGALWPALGLVSVMADRGTTSGWTSWPASSSLPLVAAPRSVSNPARAQAASPCAPCRRLAAGDRPPCRLSDGPSRKEAGRFPGRESNRKRSAPSSRAITDGTRRLASRYVTASARYARSARTR